jgi:C4-dicarboxylate-specific signal transduction histidine kinase
VTKAIAWLKKHWKTVALWVAFPIGLLVLLSKLFRPRVTVVSSEISEHEELEKELHAQTETKKKELTAVYEQKTREIHAEYDETIAENQAGAVKRAEALQNDPIQLNDYLKRVGKNVRQTKR